MASNFLIFYSAQNRYWRGKQLFQPSSTMLSQKSLWMAQQYPCDWKHLLWKTNEQTSKQNHSTVAIIFTCWNIPTSSDVLLAGVNTVLYIQSQHLGETNAMQNWHHCITSILSTLFILNPYKSPSQPGLLHLWEDEKIRFPSVFAKSFSDNRSTHTSLVSTCTV